MILVHFLYSQYTIEDAASKIVYSGTFGNTMPQNIADELETIYRSSDSEDFVVTLKVTSLLF